MRSSLSVGSEARKDVVSSVMPEEFQCCIAGPSVFSRERGTQL